MKATIREVEVWEKLGAQAMVTDTPKLHIKLSTYICIYIYI